MRRLAFAPVVLLIAVAAGAATLLRAQTVDLVIANGRVLDPESGLDAVRHMAIASGKIVAVPRTPVKAARSSMPRGSSSLPASSIFMHTARRLRPTLSGTRRCDVGVRARAGDQPISRRGTPTRAGKPINLRRQHRPYSRADGRHARSGRDLPYGDAANRAASPQRSRTITQRLAEGLKNGAVSIGAGFAYTPAAPEEELLAVFRVAATIARRSRAYQARCGWAQRGR